MRFGVREGVYIREIITFQAVINQNRGWGTKYETEDLVLERGKISLSELTTGELILDVQNFDERILGLGCVVKGYGRNKLGAIRF